MGDPSLLEVLAARGYDVEPGQINPSFRRIMLLSVCVFEGDAYQIWKWLRNGESA